MFAVFCVSFLLILVWALVQSWRQQSETLTVQSWKSFSHLLAWYLPFLFFPLLAMSLYSILIVEINLWFGLVCSALISCCIYARFIEPTTLRVQYHQYRGFLAKGQKSIKIALISDIHIGLFSGHRKQLKMIVQRINQANVDLVVVAGDWTYEPTKQQLQDIEIFRELSKPVYSVFGNHDDECPGPPLRMLLLEQFIQANIMDIEQCIVEHDGFYLVGVGDLWAGRADLSFLSQCPSDKPYVIVSHNPDTAEKLPAMCSNCLMLAGHTHSGQVKIPYLTEYLLGKKSECGHVYGWYQHEYTDIFVSRGTGMVGVPFRFLTPPTIDVIELSD